MQKKVVVLALVLCCAMLLGLLACSASTASGTQISAVKQVPPKTLANLPDTFPKIDRHPDVAIVEPSPLGVIPHYDPDSAIGLYAIDLWSQDLTSFDLTGSRDDLLHSFFDTRTKWPPADKLPKGFDAERIMELGKDPGLGIRRLHAKGVTGLGVGIAIIDTTLLVDHREYADRIRLYEESSEIPASWGLSDWHGGAVASIAVGKTIGVAPEADLYYIANHFGMHGDSDPFDLASVAECIRRVLEVNRALPVERKIRVFSMSFGWDSTWNGYSDLRAALLEAVKAGLFVICANSGEMFGNKFGGLGRLPLSDPQQFDSYTPALDWSKDFASATAPTDRLLVPMDSRTTAMPLDANGYLFRRQGGLSWTIPYIAGVYALAAQVVPDITPKVFWATAIQTGRTVRAAAGKGRSPLGPILDPIALIAALQSK
jgi:hypothetical protein